MIINLYKNYLNYDLEWNDLTMQTWHNPHKFHNSREKFFYFKDSLNGQV